MTTWSVNATTIAGLATGFTSNSPVALNSPVDITIDENNTVYVVDSLYFRVQSFTFGSINGTTIISGNTFGMSIQPSKTRYNTV